MDYYAILVKIAREAGKPVVLDCSGASLEAAIQAAVKPTVIKPNNEELSQLLGKEVSKNVEDLKEVLQDSLFDGIEWVIVSLGANGAFAKHGDVFYKVDIPKIDVVNPVGSGDSTVAGIASGLYHHESDADLLKKANVLGQIKPGIPVWQTGEESRFPLTPYVIFPGNVGEDTTLREAVEVLIQK